MKKLSLLVALACLISLNPLAAASHEWFHQAGNWTDPNKWTGDGDPNGSAEVLIRYADSQCLLNSDAGDWNFGQRMRVCEDANLVIADGAKLLGVSWLRVGTPEGPGEAIQTGGTVRLKGGKDNTKLTIGDSSQGTYTISGGTITHLDGGGYLILGYRGGEGTLTVIGTGPKIEMGRLYVGGNTGEKAGTGTLEYKIGSDGVSPVRISGKIFIDPQEDISKTNLIVSATAEPPKADIVLIDSKGYDSIEGVFDTLTDAKGTNPAAEGAAVVLKHGQTECNYKLTYRYDAAKDGSSNDVALVYTAETQ